MLFLLFLSVFSMASVLDGQTLGGPMHGKKVVCYVASWATYRVKLGQYNLDHLDPAMCTHIVYSFAGLDPERNVIKSLDPWQDLEKNDGMAGYKGLVALKNRYPHLKCTIAIGGWNEGSPKYSKMASQLESRKTFIQSVMTFLHHYGFDGLDLDWEYPTKREGKPEDRENFVLLVKELSEAFEPRGYILTAALGAGKSTMDSAYDLTKLSRYLDLIHMMCYDYHGTWDGVVGAHSPLRSAGQDGLNVEFTIKYMIDHGVPASKLVLGVPFYGRTFVLQNPNVRDIEFGKTPVLATGFSGPYIKEAGFMGYNEICMELKNNSSWRYHWDKTTATPYLRDGGRVICFDNCRSVALKVKMAIDKGLGGLMVWSVDTDDFLGQGASEQDAYEDILDRLNKINRDPALNAALRTLNLRDDKRVPCYYISNGQLSLRRPLTGRPVNYKLLRTINDATTLAIQEKNILEGLTRAR